MRQTLRFLILAACVVAPVTACADTTSTILPEYNGEARYTDPGPYQPATVIGSFTIDPAATAITLSGTFGNSLTPTSSGLDLYLGSILVAQCVQYESCYALDTTSPTPWSTTLTTEQIALLGTGLVDLTVVQTSQFWIRLGETTLTQTTPDTPAVPEPSTLVLLASGTLAAAGSLRRRLSL